MKVFKTLLAVIACVAMLTSSALGTTVFAEDELIETVSGIRWFPVPKERQNDDAWEVECVADGCLCQRFTETAEDTGNSNFLDTAYTADGGLKLTRNDSEVILGGQDYTSRYWPRIRTLSLETSPEFDLKTANTLYFDIDVEEGTEWNLTLSINGMVVGFGKFMAAAAGAAFDPMDASIVDAPSGSYKGSVNIVDIIDRVAADASHMDNVNATALKNMKKTFVPQVQIYVVGGIGSSLTINELYIAPADDPAGETCSFVDMGLLTGLGDEYYLDDDPGEFSDPDNTETIGTIPTEDETDDTTTKATTTANDSGKSDTSAMPVVIIVVAVVVAAAIVVTVIVLKKKS